jgi:hypothetical protein
VQTRLHGATERASHYTVAMARMPRSTTRIGTIVVAAVAVLTLAGCPSNGGTGGTGGGYGLGPDVSVVVEAPAGAVGG